MIPWASPYLTFEEINEVVDAIKTGWISMGKRTKLFEEKMAKFNNRKYAIAVSNGTFALDLALKAISIRPGDEVILPAMTYIATLNAVLYQGATPIFADIEIETYNVDPISIKKKITQKTKAIIVIDYGGNPCNYRELENICKNSDIPLIHDGAQSIGGKYQNKTLCKFGLISTTSFHVAKPITSVEGGMIFTDDEEIAQKVNLLRNQGEDPEEKYNHLILGYNARMSDLHAAIGLAQLKKMNRIFRRRTEIAMAYNEELKSVEEITLPKTISKCEKKNEMDTPIVKNGWFFYPVLIENRDSIAKNLRDHGIDTRICYPKPVYDQPFFKRTKYLHVKPYCPVTEYVTARVLNLPVYHKLKKSQIKHIAKILKKAIYTNLTKAHALKRY